MPKSVKRIVYEELVRFRRNLKEKGEHDGDFLLASYVDNFVFMLPGGHYREIDKEREKLFQTIDSCFSQLGIDTKEIVELEGKLITSKHSFNLTPEGLAEGEKQIKKYREIKQQIAETSFPVYIKLRALGYKHYPDLGGNPDVK